MGLLDQLMINLYSRLLGCTNYSVQWMQVEFSSVSTCLSLNFCANRPRRDQILLKTGLISFHLLSKVSQGSPLNSLAILILVESFQIFCCLMGPSLRYMSSSLTQLTFRLEVPLFLRVLLSEGAAVTFSSSRSPASSFWQVIILSSAVALAIWKEGLLREVSSRCLMEIASVWGSAGVGRMLGGRRGSRLGVAMMEELLWLMLTCTASAKIQSIVIYFLRVCCSTRVLLLPVAIVLFLLAVLLLVSCSGLKQISIRKTLMSSIHSLVAVESNLATVASTPMRWARVPFFCPWGNCCRKAMTCSREGLRFWKNAESQIGACPLFMRFEQQLLTSHSATLTSQNTEANCPSDSGDENLLGRWETIDCCPRSLLKELQSTFTEQPPKKNKIII